MSLGASEWIGDTPLGIRIQSFALTWTGKRAPGAVAIRRDGSAILRYTSYRMLPFAFIQRRYLRRRMQQSAFALNLTRTTHARGAWNVNWPNRTAAPAPCANLGLTQPARLKASAPTGNFLAFATELLHNSWTLLPGDGRNPGRTAAKNFRMNSLVRV